MTKQQIDPHEHEIDLWSTACSDYTPDLKVHIQSCTRCQAIFVERMKGPFISLQELKERLNDTQTD